LDAIGRLVDLLPALAAASRKGLVHRVQIDPEPDDPRLQLFQLRGRHPEILIKPHGARRITTITTKTQRHEEKLSVLVSLWFNPFLFGDEGGAEILAVEARDVADLDVLGTGGLALVLVGAMAE